MIDFHSHIIPGIDDGAPDPDTALEMLKIAEKHGTTAMVATPHVIEGDWLPDWEEILAKYEQLKIAARDAGIQVELYPGAEVAVNMELLSRLTGPGPYCINQGKYMLVELPALEIPDFFEEFFFRLQSREIKPILAHPERNPKIAAAPQILVEWIRRGLLIQVNTSSITGKMGERTAATAEILLANQMVHFIGSDAHGVKSRRPKLDEGASRIRELMGREMEQRLLRANPEMVLRNDDLRLSEVAEMVFTRRAKSFFGHLTGRFKEG